jgi:putative copper resistance protein D
MPLQDAKPLLVWSEPLVQLLGFAALFLAAGSIGFRYIALRGRLHADAPTDAASSFVARAARRAASAGLVGAALHLALLLSTVPAAARKAHLSSPQLVTTDVSTGVPLLLAILAIGGLIVAARGEWRGWPVAAVGVVLGALPQLLTAQWSRLVNPAHALAAALWIGTLFVMVTSAIGPAVRDERVGTDRERIVADMVHAFSPAALSLGGIVVLFGLITAWQHLNPLTSLFTTPYGYALIAKLTAVAAVFGLGAWNWRRQRPLLGTESSAASLRRSATAELWAAVVVLLITSVLVSLPSPRPPKAVRSSDSQTVGQPTD